MKTFSYRAVLEPGDEGGWVVSFPDVPEAITQGDDEVDALAEASDALGLALLSYLRIGKPLPKARSKQGVPVSLNADVAAKVAVIEAFERLSMSKTEFARRLGKNEKEVRRILDPLHPTKLATLVGAMRVLGQRLVVGIEPIAA